MCLLACGAYNLSALELNQVQRKGISISQWPDYINHSGKQYPQTARE